MPSSFTDSLRLEMIGIGEQDATWGGANSSNMRMLEAAISGIASVVMASDADRTLTTANNSPDEARNAFLLVTSGVSLTATRAIIVPGGAGRTKLYAVKNATTGGQSIQVKTASGAAVTVPNGGTRFIWCDGTDCALVVDVASEISTSRVQVAAIVPTAKVGAVDAGYLLCDGAAYSRTTYQALFEALSLRPTGNVASGSPTVSAVSSTDYIEVGMPISGSGIPVGTTVAGVGVGTITLSQNATGTGTGVALCIAPHGVGDGSTTFNVPDYVGRTLFGVDPGEATGRLTAAISGITQRIGATGGDQRLHQHNHSVTDPGHAHGYTDAGHAHGYSDPGHIHSAWTDVQGYHDHATTTATGWGVSSRGSGATAGVIVQGGDVWRTDGNGSHGHNVGIGGATVGITISGATIGITISTAATGITLGNAGAGGSQNVPPAGLARWQIKT